MLVHWIWLATRPGMNDRIKAAVIERFGDAEDVFYADSGAYQSVDGLTVEACEALQDKSLTEARGILAQCTDKDIGILTFRDAAYPSRLKNISDPPMVLYYKGRLPDFDALPLIAVVGTRKASAYGITAAKRMGYGIAQCGGVVVSGIASGIDGAAMSAALTAGGTVVGVLGNGADIVYPLSNRALFADTERRGCLLTEFPPGTPPHKWNFPKRNRIISGLSCGVLVVEAPFKSGSLITARQAAEQGRDVFVVPGNIDVPTFAGSNALLRDGAIVATTGWDVVGEYQALYPDYIKRFDQPGTQTAYPDEVARTASEDKEKTLKVAQNVRLLDKIKAVVPKKDKKVIDNGEKPPYSDVEKSLPTLTAEEQAIVDQLKQGQRLRDDVIAATGLPAGKVAATLTILEVKGVIQRLPGNWLTLK